MSQPDTGNHEDLGEGNKKSDRDYREHVEKFLDKQDPLKLGREAAAEIDKEEQSGNHSLRDAEAVGKSHIAEEDPEVSGNK